LQTCYQSHVGLLTNIDKCDILPKIQLKTVNSTQAFSQSNFVR